MLTRKVERAIKHDTNFDVLPLVQKIWDPQLGELDQYMWFCVGHILQLFSDIVYRNTRNILRNRHINFRFIKNFHRSCMQSPTTCTLLDPPYTVLRIAKHFQLLAGVADDQTTCNAIRRITEKLITYNSSKFSLSTTTPFITSLPAHRKIPHISGKVWDTLAFDFAFHYEKQYISSVCEAVIDAIEIFQRIAFTWDR